MQMKKFLAILVLGTALSVRAFGFGIGAQTDFGYSGGGAGYGLALSLAFGDRMGTNKGAPWLAVSLGGGSGYFHLGANVDWHLLIIPFGGDAKDVVQFYLGAGVGVGTAFGSWDNGVGQKDGYFGLDIAGRLPIGFQFFVPGADEWDMFLEVVPALGLDMAFYNNNDYYDLYWAVGLTFGFHYWF